MSAEAVPRIVIAGGGPAALEALLALREWLPPERARIGIVAPDPALRYRPLSAIAEFATHPAHALALSELAAACDAELITDRLALVEPGRVLVRDGNWIPYDRLLVAVGAAELPLPPGWQRWPPQGDPAALECIIRELGEGHDGQLAVYVPESSGWPLAGYELALILACARRENGNRAAVELICESPRPLAVLGAEAEAIVAEELHAAELEPRLGTRLAGVPEAHPEVGPDWVSALLARVLGHAPRRRQRAGVEARVDGRRAWWDRLVAQPASRGPALPGLAADEHGYVAIGEGCRVLGTDEVWAAGDCTPLALKHSTLAVAQAGCAAATIAATLGADVEPCSASPVLTGILVPGAAARWWAENASRPPGLEPATHCLWWPSGLVLGPRLARFVAHRDPAARPHLLSHPRGTAIRIAFPPPAAAGVLPAIPADAATAAAREHDACERQLLAIERLERDAERRLERLEARLAEERRDSAEVLAHLNQAGYLVKDQPLGRARGA